MVSTSSASTGPSTSYSPQSGTASSTTMMSMISNDEKSSPHMMVYRKLIYTNRKSGYHLPKLALFAAIDIPAYAEIVI